MSEKEYLFGYEAQKVILEALGIDPGNKNFAIQHIQINLGFQAFPFITLTVAPTSELFEDERFKELFAKSIIDTINPAIYEQISEHIKPEIEQLINSHGGIA